VLRVAIPTQTLLKNIVLRTKWDDCGWKQTLEEAKVLAERVLRYIPASAQNDLIAFLHSLTRKTLSVIINLCLRKNPLKRRLTRQN
jgi:hypothetical protein